MSRLAFILNRQCRGAVRFVSGGASKSGPDPARIDRLGGMRILVVEDDASLCDGLRELLEGAGHEALVANDGVAGLAAARREGVDLAIFDVLLPELDGISACRQLRATGSHLPVIMLTALGDEDDKVRGLEAGADDFVTKPFGSRELLARIDALARRTRPSGCPETLRADGCLLDLGACAAVRDGVSVALSPREADILRWLERHRGRALSRADLLEHVWRVPRTLRTRAVDMAIATLRQKIEEDPAHPRIIVSVKGIGYAWGPR